MADVTKQLSEANRTLGLHSLAIIPYDVMAILITVDEFELFNTVTLQTTEGCPVYLFKKPKNLRFAKAVTLDHEYLSDFEYFADIDSGKCVGMRAMLITSAPIHFVRRLDEWLLSRISKLIHVSKISLLDLVHFNTHQFLLNKPSCLVFYGANTTLNISTENNPSVEVVMKQGDMFLGTEITILASFETKCSERSVFLLLES